MLKPETLAKKPGSKKKTPPPGASQGKPSLKTQGRARAVAKLTAMQAKGVSPLGAALRTFHRVMETLGLLTEDQLKLLNMGKTKYFESLRQPAPALDVDSQDRLGYCLAIVELAEDLVGDAGAWLRAPNRAPAFAGKPPLELLLAGRFEGIFTTLTYLRGAYGGWA